MFLRSERRSQESYFERKKSRISDGGLQHSRKSLVQWSEGCGFQKMRPIPESCRVQVWREIGSAGCPGATSSSRRACVRGTLDWIWSERRKMNTMRADAQQFMTRHVHWTPVRFYLWCVGRCLSHWCPKECLHRQTSQVDESECTASF